MHSTAHAAPMSRVSLSFLQDRNSLCSQGSVSHKYHKKVFGEGSELEFLIILSYITDEAASTRITFTVICVVLWLTTSCPLKAKSSGVFVLI